MSVQLDVAKHPVFLHTVACVIPDGVLKLAFFRFACMLFITDDHICPAGFVPLYTTSSGLSYPNQTAAE